MRKLSHHEKQHKRWRKALGVARVLFEEDGYHTTYLDEIEAVLGRADDIPPQQGPQQAAPSEHHPGQYRIEYYPNSRFWGVYDSERLIAVTVYKRGAREVVGRMEMQERTIADLKRQFGLLPSLG